MRLVGLKTDSIFRRYDIVDEFRLEGAAARINTLGEVPDRTVVALDAHKMRTVSADSHTQLAKARKTSDRVAMS